MANEKESMKKQIFEYLQNGGALTPLKALKMFKCLSLHARIFDLRREGVPIQTTLILTETKKRVAEYRIIKIEQNGK